MRLVIAHVAAIAQEVEGGRRAAWGVVARLIDTDTQTLINRSEFSGKTTDPPTLAHAEMQAALKIMQEVGLTPLTVYTRSRGILRAASLGKLPTKDTGRHWQEFFDLLRSRNVRFVPAQQQSLWNIAYQVAKKELRL